MRRLSWNVETNAWNRIRYTLWAPVYDLVGRRFDGQRRASLRLLALRPEERVLIVGAGTGADIPYLPEDCIAIVTDFTPAMLARARPRLRDRTHLAIMDGHDLAVRFASCDAVVLHLILAVIPDPLRCLQESARVLRPGGRVVVFDKFVRSQRPAAALRLLNLVTRVLFTDVTRNLEDIVSRSGAPLRIEHDEPALFKGLFRRVLLRRHD
ncbi:MAG TPA: methyltransferase domain-containing protein [Vicinamibacteria bacterium]|nr:methyltransferase domain-containing protein [Vicinamibacteria bacterium]